MVDDRSMTNVRVVDNEVDVVDIILLDRCLRHRGGEPDQAPEFHAGAYFV